MNLNSIRILISVFKDPSEKKGLFCYYESRISKNAWAIGPVKVEILSLHPLIVQYYDIIGDKMIELIKQAVEPSLNRSTVVDESRVGENKISEYRTATSTWITDHARQPFTVIPKTISAITGMNSLGTLGAARLQVAAYAFGGHYDVHVDAVSLQTCNLAL